jgi:hypothetical protein
MEDEYQHVRARLTGIAGTPLDDAEVVKLLGEVLSGGGGVVIELDRMGFKLVRREGKFVLQRDPTRRPPSTMPPRR